MELRHMAQIQLKCVMWIERKQNVWSCEEMVTEIIGCCIEYNVSDFLTYFIVFAPYSQLNSLIIEFHHIKYIPMKWLPF